MNITKYKFNQTIFILAQIGLYVSFWALLTQSLSWFAYILIFLGNIIILHYHLNLVHIATHRLLSKNKVINSFFGNIAAIAGGVTFADFQSTHALHHAFANNTEKDPDYPIVNSRSFLLIPFKIWFHDRYFWQYGLWKKDRLWLGYLIDRAIQIALVLALFLSGNIMIWIYFWLVPELIVGLLNGLFLFYFPHFSTKYERFWRSFFSHNESIQPVNSLGILLAKLSLESINISRYYHQKHHEKILENRNYFPLEVYLLNILKPIEARESIHNTTKYTDMYGILPHQTS